MANRNCDTNDYTALSKEELERKIQEYKREHSVERYAETIDEGIKYLMDGYFNTTIRSHIEPHFMRMIQNEYFHKWPLIRRAYASDMLHGMYCAKNVERAIEILIPLANDGCDGAIYDIGYCYKQGIKFDKSYNKCIYLWIKASKNGYREAQRALEEEYRNKDYKNASEELRFYLLDEIYRFKTEGKNITDKVTQYFSELEIKKLNLIISERNRLSKFVVERQHLRDASRLFWNDEENPYRIIT